MVNYHLIHKDRMAAELEFDPEGESLLSIRRVSETQLLPLSCQNQPDKLKYWWAQGRIKTSGHHKTVLWNILIRLSEGKTIDRIEKEASDFFGPVMERKNINACGQR